MEKTSPPFLESSALKKLFEILETQDMPMLRIVGGAVRNHCLGVPVHDIDLATLWTPDQVIEKCKEHAVKAIPTGIDHGTVTLVIEGQSFEVTTLRKDVETDGRRAVVAYTDSWEDDAQRRDFTINALYMDQNGQIFDPLREGLHDLKRKHIRFVGDPVSRIQEDALRILRFYRFSAHYGEGALDHEGAKACHSQMSLLKNISRERVTDELIKICKGAYSLPILKRMEADGVFSTLGALHCDLDALEAIDTKQKRYDVYHVLPRLFCLFGGDTKLCQKILSLSNKQRHFLTALEEARAQESLPVKSLLYHYGRDVAQQALLFREVSDEEIETAKTWTIPVFPVTGEDLIALGFSEGKALGVALKKIEAHWIDQGFGPKDSVQNSPYLLSLRNQRPLND